MRPHQELRDDALLFDIAPRWQQHGQADARQGMVGMVKKINPLQVITANDLLTGAVVYLDTDDQWNRNLNAAMIFKGSACAQSRINSLQDADACVVGIDVITISMSPVGHIEPVHIREHLRLHGPSVDYRSHNNPGR